MPHRQVTAGILQYGPVHGQLDSSMEKLGGMLKDAADKGVELAVVGESWLSGYPAWLDVCPQIARWNHSPTKKVFAALYRNSVTINGPEVTQIRKWAKQYGLVLGMGINERVENGLASGSLFNTLLIIDADGRLLNHHRKLVPTYTERLVHAHGDAHGLQAVDTAVGKVGGLICWEHWMPISRHAMHTSGEEIHLALWPTVHEMHQIASRQYAFEGRCFVLAAGQLMQAHELPPSLEVGEELVNTPEAYVMRGGSTIIGPDGMYMKDPIYEEATLLVSKLDLDVLAEERMNLDTTGHYFRPELFQVNIDRRRLTDQ